MTLAEYVKHKQGEILRFQEAWIKCQAEFPKDFSLSFPDKDGKWTGVHEWNEQYAAWLELCSPKETNFLGIDHGKKE